MPKPYQPNDKWSRRAASDGYRARSVYKLMELNERFHLFEEGMTVLDLGAAPGSWLQFTSEEIGENGKAIGMDLTEIKPIAPNVKLYQQDITDEAAVRDILAKEGIRFVDLVLSDIAPNTSGTWDIDQWRSVELVRAVAKTAMAFLKPGGVLIVKVFRGADFDDLLNELRATWSMVRMAHVEATRDRSKEVYVLLKK